MHPKDEDVYPAGTVVWWTRTGELARIVPVFRFEGKFFSHYLAEFEDREGQYCVLHDEVILEALPPEEKQRAAE